MSSQSDTSAIVRRRASDWIGFLGHIGITVVALVRMPALSLFILPPVIHMVLAGGSFLVRDAPRKKEQSPAGRIVSYAGGFGMFAFFQFATVFAPGWLAVTDVVALGVTGYLLGLLGLFVEIWAIWHLRFSFSTEPAARRLVLSGPYRFARHPIYSGACIAHLGLLMTRPTLAIAIALAGWAICIGFRMRYEEAILSSAFAEYSEYRKRVGALFSSPRFFGAPDKSTATATGI